MALMDMNGDGKNDIADDFLEYMIVSGEMDEEEQEEEEIDYVPMYPPTPTSNKSASTYNRSASTYNKNSSVKQKEYSSTDKFVDEHPILSYILGCLIFLLICFLIAVGIKYILPIVILIVVALGCAGKK